MPFHQLLNQAPRAPSVEAGADSPKTTFGKAPAPIRGPPQPPFPHLTTQELAARWRCTTFTLSNNYRKWGLRPIKISKRLLFPLDQIEAVERRHMDGGEE